MTEETKRPEDKFDFAKFTAQARNEIETLQKSISEADNPAAVGAAIALARGASLAVASIADSLQRIANAQEMIAQLTNIDLDATIQQGSRILYAEMKAKENAGNEN